MRKLALLLCALSLSACVTQSPASLEATDHATCARAQDYNACRNRQLAYREQDTQRRAAMAESFQRAGEALRDPQPAVVVVPRY